MNIAKLNQNQPTELQQAPVDIKLTKPVICETCGCETFREAVILREVSAILSGSGKSGYLPISVFACSAKGHVNQAFLPAELKKPKIS